MVLIFLNIFNNNKNKKYFGNKMQNLDFTEILKEN